MPTIYLRGGTNSALSVSGQLFSKVLVETVEVSVQQNISVGAGATVYGYAFTNAGVPGRTDAPVGDYIVELDLPTAHANIAIAVAVARVSSTGTVLSQSAFSAEQTGASGVSLYTLTNVNLGTWASTDRLRVTYQFRNTNSMNTRSVTIAHGSQNNEVTAPFETIDTTPPSQVTGLTATPGDQQVALSWSAATDDTAVTGYEYRVNSGTPVNVGNVLAATPSGLTNGVSYNFEVRAYDAASNYGAWSSIASATPADTTAPGTPTNFGTVDLATGVGVQWTNPSDTDLAQVLIERSDTGGGTGYTVIHTVNSPSPGASLSYNDTATNDGQTYYYRARAADEVPNYSAYTAEVSGTNLITDTTPPSQVTGLVATPGDSQVTLDWEAATDNVAVTGYEYRIDAGTPVDVGNVLTTVVGSLTNGTSYNFEVRAYDNFSNFGAWSTVVSATPFITTPDETTVYLQVFASDGVTPYTDRVSVGTYASLTTTNQTLEPTFTLTAAGTTAGKAAWDAARAELSMDYVDNTGETLHIRVTAFELFGEYSTGTVTGFAHLDWNLGLIQNVAAESGFYLFLSGGLITRAAGTEGAGSLTLENGLPKVF